MTRYIQLLLLLLLTLPLTGCWDRLEINDMAIVDVVGIDKAPKGLRLTISVIVPERAAPGNQTGGGGGGDGNKGTGSVIIFDAEGESVMDAAIRIQERLSRRLFWAHARVLAIGEEYARAGVRPALDFWSRHPEPRLRMKIVITPGKAAEFVQGRPALEHLLSEAVRETINLRLQSDVNINQFVNRLRSTTEEPFAPRVTLYKRPSGHDALVRGTALFRDDRLIGWLTDKETRGLLWLRGEVRTSVTTIDIPSGGRLSMKIIRSKTELKPYFKAGKLHVKTMVDVEDDIYESSAPIDLGKVEIVSTVQGMMEQEIKGRIESTLTKLQKEFGVDAIGFGDAVYRAAPRLWEGGLKHRWAQAFRELEIEVEVTARVKRTGELAAPLSVDKEKVKKSPQEMLQKKE